MLNQSPVVFLEHRPRVLISVARDVGMYGKGECRCLKFIVVEHVNEVAVMTGWVEDIN